MRILHTADWHIGKKLLRRDLYEDQQYVMNQLIEYIKEHPVDVVVIAGDLYDTTQPSKEAMQFVNDTLRIINIELKTPTLIISGNHDSQSRLSYASDWFKAMNVTIHTSIEDAVKPVSIGDVDFYLVPYFDVLEVKHHFDDASIETHHDVYARIIESINAVIDKNKKNILVSHLFVRGGAESKSERSLFRGLSSEVDPRIFDAFDHVLLGHLHHPFAIDRKNVHYAGSLIKYSFSEASQPKGFRVIDTDSDGQSHFIKFKLLRDCIVFEGHYDDVINGRVESLLGRGENRDAFYQFTLEGLDGITEPMARIQSIYPNALELKRKVTHTKRDDKASLKALSSDADVFEQFLDAYLDDELKTHAHTLFSKHFKEDHDETN